MIEPRQLRQHAEDSAYAGEILDPILMDLRHHQIRLDQRKEENLAADIEIDKGRHQSKAMEQRQGNAHLAAQIPADDLRSGLGVAEHRKGGKLHRLGQRGRAGGEDD